MTGVQENDCDGTTLLDALMACEQGDAQACNRYKQTLEWMNDNCSGAIAENEPKKSDESQKKKTSVGASQSEESKITAESDLWIPPSSGGAVSCPLWAVTQDFTRYGPIELNNYKNSCVFVSNSLLPLNIALPANLQPRDKYIMAIPKEGREDIFRVSDNSWWNAEEQDPTRSHDFIALFITNTGIEIAFRGGNRSLAVDAGMWSANQSLVIKLAILSYLDPGLRIIRQPTAEKGAVVRGSYRGQEYLAGISNSFYQPIQLGSPTKNAELLRLLSSGNDLKEPLRSMVEEWHRNTSEKSIRACVTYTGGARKYPNPDAAWQNTNDAVSGNANFLIADKRGGFEIYGPNANALDQVDWYRGVANYNNPYLAMLAIADPALRIIRHSPQNRRLALFSGDSDNLYVLQVPENGGKPLVRKVFLLENGQSAKSLAQVLLKDDRVKPPLDKILSDWIYQGIENPIIACVERGRPGRYKSPDEAWNSGIRQFSGGSTDSLNYILGDGQILGPAFTINVPWYQQLKHIQNPWLAMLAIADPNATIVEVIPNDRVIMVPGHPQPDNLYAIDISSRNSSRPKIKRVMDEVTLPFNYITEKAALCRDIDFYRSSTFAGTARKAAFDQ
jgi:hypothetical protein